MKFKLIVALVRDEITNAITETAREHGATGCTVITSARGEGLTPTKSILGLSLAGQSDVCLFLAFCPPSLATFG